MSAEEYRKIIKQLIQKLDETDLIFIRQIYTLIKKHLDRMGRL